MRDLVVRTDDKRLEVVAWIQPGGQRTRDDLLRLAFELRDFLNHFRRLVRHGAIFCRRSESHLPRLTESRDDRGLQCGHVITLNPELVDVVRDQKSELIVGDIGQSHRGEPALVSIRAHLRFERRGKLRPCLGTLLVHT